MRLEIDVHISTRINPKWILALLLFTTCFPLFGQAEKDNKGTIENPFSVPETASAMKIDGVLDENAWANAVKIELNYEVRPRENVQPPVRTEALLTYDRTHFYIGFRCYDPDPSQIRAHYSNRDSFGGDDWVALEIDTYNDSRRAFTLFSTPLGGQADGISDAAGIKDYNWDMIYDSAGKITIWGYSVEIAIPFSSLRFQRTKDSQVWGINIVRGYPRNVMYQIWAQPYDRSNTCRVCQYIKIQGFKDVSPGRNVEINPTLTGKTTNERPVFPEGDFVNRNKITEAGLTTRWGITPNLVLTGTLNPEFSQVEADSAQLDVNQPFALYYPERRPFFTEGLDFFRTPLNIIYTRTLRDPQWGIKLSGKMGPYAVGAYVVRDKITNLIFPGSQYSSSFSMTKPNTSTVFRFARDIWNNSTLGVFFANRNGEDYFNRVYGIDSNLRFSQKDEVVFQVLGSSTQYSDTMAETFSQPEGDFQDKAITAKYIHQTRFHKIEVGYFGLGKDFRADLGFLPQVGIRQIQASSNYNWIPKKSDSWWSRFVMRNVASYTSDSEGNLLDKALSNSFTFSGFLQTSVTIENIISRQHYNGIDFNLLKFNFNATVIPNGNIWINIRSSYGDGIDYVNTRKGKRILLAPNLSYNIGKHLRLNLSHTFERMTVENNRLYTANISQASIVYFFSTKLFIRSILQYYDYNYNHSNYILPAPARPKQFFTQLLFSYKINPRTVLFLGYSDNYFDNPGHGLIQKDYTFFVKIGYAWVL